MRGTATNLKNKHYQIAGKTGTAQIAKENEGYRQKSYDASFAGYFPADNPKYSCIVIVNDPVQGKYYGGSVAAPIAGKVIDSYLSLFSDAELNAPVKHYNDSNKQQEKKSKPRSDKTPVRPSAHVEPDNTAAAHYKEFKHG